MPLARPYMAPGKTSRMIEFNISSLYINSLDQSCGSYWITPLSKYYKHSAGSLRFALIYTILSLKLMISFKFTVIPVLCGFSHRFLSPRFPLLHTYSCCPFLLLRFRWQSLCVSFAEQLRSPLHSASIHQRKYQPCFFDMSLYARYIIVHMHSAMIRITCCESDLKHSKWTCALTTSRMPSQEHRFLHSLSSICPRNSVCIR